MIIRYRFNFAFQITLGAAAFVGVLLTASNTQPSSYLWLGAGLIGVGCFVLSGFRLRRRIRKVYILVGHPNPNKTYSDELANAYEQGARDSGYTVVRQDISKLSFDPILHKGYDEIQELEPDLKKVQDNILWADHFVLIYPNWWSTMPAILKGLFDRIWLPGFAFNFHAFGWKKLLKGRTARVLITLDNHPLLAWMVFGDYTNEIQNALLEFAGIQPADVTQFGSLKFRSQKSKKSLVRKAYRMGRWAL